MLKGGDKTGQISRTEARVYPRHDAVTARCPSQAPGAQPAPVEYAVAVDRYLAEASLGAASRRVYRISLTGWAWALVGLQAPRGALRRGAAPPVVPLALLDHDDAAGRLAEALADRQRMADARTVNRELSALRSAVGWWQEQQWVSRDPTAGLRNISARCEPVPPLTHGQVADLFRVRTTLREHAFWRVLYESGAQVDAVLAMNAGRLDLAAAVALGIPGSPADSRIRWQQGTSELLGWLLAGRRDGPVFLTDRRAPANAPPADVCPLSRRARMSNRRAAEIFTTATRQLDPAGRSWTLSQLRTAGLRDSGSV
jgi:hypothetical protein